MANTVRKDRGAALILAIITLVVCFTLGMAISAMTMTNLRAAKAIQNRTLAFNIAESGADQAIRYLKQLGSPRADVTPFSLPNMTNASLAGGKFTVLVTPDPKNGNNILKKYNIRCQGTIGGYSETVDILIRQQSFGKYAYFTDKEVSSISGGAIWFFSNDHIRGPAHSNSRNSSEFQIDWTTSTTPIFDGQVTSAASTITYTPKAPGKESDFLKIYKTGSKGYQLDVDPIDLPSSTLAQKNAAWGAESGFPSSTGVYIPSNGGIYIVGDSKISAYVANGSDQGFKITQGSNIFEVVVSASTGVTKMRKNSGAWSTTTSANTGVIYSTGSVTALSGEIADNTVSNGSVSYRNAFTVCTDVLNGKNITINDDLTYHTSYDSSQSNSSTNNLKAGCLGLIGRNVIVDPNAPTALDIDALILAGSSSTSDGSFYVSNYSTKATGTLKVTGGIIQNSRGPVGTLSSGALKTGYAKDYYYDARLADNPPPYFPTTGGYDRISWIRTANSG
jgi:hypothetical protein